MSEMVSTSVDLSSNSTQSWIVDLSLIVNLIIDCYFVSERLLHPADDRSSQCT